MLAGYYAQLDDLYAVLADAIPDAEEHVQRLLEHLRQGPAALTMTEQEKEYSLQLREMHQTQVDMRQNQIMKILTIVTTVFLPLSLIAGWYGMNFRNMPELTAEHGYLVICIVSAVCVLVELWIFKRKKMVFKEAALWQSYPPTCDISKGSERHGPRRWRSWASPPCVTSSAISPLLRGPDPDPPHP